MKLKLIAIGILPFVLSAVVNAQTTASSTQDEKHYTPAQLKQLVRDAHTPEEYHVIATYYGDRQKSYLSQAAEEKQEWERRSQNVTGALAKYPRPVDTAHYLYEYYDRKAAEAGTLSAKYSKQAISETGVKTQ